MKNFVNPWIEVQNFAVTDVITTSGDQGCLTDCAEDGVSSCPTDTGERG